MSTPRPFPESCDVLVAGAGGAGLMAAIAAASAGARVVVCEKLPDLLGSSTALAVGRVSFCDTHIQRQAGIEDSIELMTEDLLRTGRYLNDRALVDAFMQAQGQTWEILRAIGVQWSPTVTAVAGMSVPRGHLTQARTLIQRLHRRAIELGVEIIFDAAVRSLLIGRSSRVEGAQVQRADGLTLAIQARRGVVLASGGFARDPERLALVDPRFRDVRSTSGIGHTGDALRMTAELGALTRDLEHVQPSFEQHVDGYTSADILILYYRGGIIVNAAGERFIDESVSYKDIARACLDQPGQMGFQIFDHTVFERAVDEFRRAGQGSPMTLDAHRRGLLLQGASIDDLARACRISAEPLQATISRYNREIDAGGDCAYGRRHLSGTFGRPFALRTPPFYAYPTIGHLLATYAGLAVDPLMRVLNREGPIPGLLAAGEAVGGFHGASYQSGTAIAKALVFGRLAGLSAARATPVAFQH
jgi:fumarate reductase flavoprotein subunit